MKNPLYFVLLPVFFLACRKDSAITPQSIPEKQWQFQSVTVGGLLGDAARGMAYYNNRLFLSGSTASAGNGMTDLYLVIADTSLNILAEKYIGGAADDVGISAYTTTNGVLLSGYTESFGNRQAWLVNVNVNGDTLWTKHYNITSSSVAFNVTADANGFYIVGNSADAYGSTDLLLIRTDLNGDTLWTKNYGGNLSELGTGIEILSNGELIIYAHTYSFGNGDRDLWLLKTNANGDSLQSLFIGGAGYEQPGYMNKTAAGKILISAHYASNEPNHNFYNAMLDENLTILWQYESGGMMHDGSEDIIESDNGFFSIGPSMSQFSTDSDVMVTELKSDGSYNRTFYYDAGADESVFQIIRTGNSFYLSGTKTTGGNQDVLVVKMK
ncbi:MAG: hypothetical protein ACOZCO_12895 [Bacteroidota bacterium]